VSPTNEIPEGYKLGNITSVQINDISKDKIAEGKYADGSLWASVLLDTVCDICVINTTASVVKIGTGRRLLLSIVPKSISSITFIKTQDKSMVMMIFTISLTVVGIVLTIVGARHHMNHRREIAMNNDKV
tara:strand:- start:114 stop:503 length:390 start_codon:yes stop_codon:yes gene_type:complete